MLRMTFERTPEMLEALEEAICQAHGDLNTACRALRTSPRYVHMWILAEPEVATRVRQAQMIGWAGLESAAYQRAVLGVEEDVYYQGDVVGQVTKYSDSLLSKMLVARVPGYGEQQHLHTHMVNVNVMPRASSYEEWRDQREKELAPQETILEGVYKELPRPPDLIHANANDEVYRPRVLRDVL